MHTASFIKSQYCGGCLMIKGTFVLEIQWHRLVVTIKNLVTFHRSEEVDRDNRTQVLCMLLSMIMKYYGDWYGHY